MGAEAEELMENGIPVSMYTQLVRNIERRGDIVDKFFKGGAPEDNRDIRVAKEVMESQDTAILSLGKLNKDAQSQNDAVADIAAEIIRQVAQNKQQESIGVIPEIDDSIIPVDIIEGETDVGIIQKDYSDIIKG